MWKREEIQELLWNEFIKKSYILIQREGDKLIDIQEISNRLDELNSKLKKIGDSL